jgi:hypothetical protein
MSSRKIIAKNKKHTKKKRNTQKKKKKQKRKNYRHVEPEYPDIYSTPPA